MVDAVRRDRVIVGPPGILTVWTFEVVKALVELSRSVRLRVLDRTDTIDGDAGPQDGLPFVYLTQYPGSSVIEAIREGRLSVLVVREPPLDALAFMQRMGNFSLKDALRSQTAAAVANLEIRACSDVVVLERAGHHPAADLIAGLGSWLSIPTDAAVLAPLVDRFGGGKGDAGLEAALARHVSGYAPLIEGAPTGEAEQAAALVAKVLEPLADFMGEAVLRPIVWPTEVLLSGDRPNEPAPRIAAVAGPARVLYYGPYLHLPPADYRVEILLAFSREVQDLPFSLEVHGRTCLARVRIDGRGGGGYRGSFRMTHKDPIDALEIRLRSERGAIEGELALIEVRFHPVEAEHAAVLPMGD